MVPQSRAAGESGAAARPRLRHLVPPARAYLLVIDALAAVLTVVAVTAGPVAPRTAAQAAALLALSIGYSELAARTERLRQYLGGDRISAAPLSVWAFAAVLTVPPGWAAAVVVAQYVHAVGRARRDRSGHLHRVVFSGAATVLAALAAGGALSGVSGPGPGDSVRAAAGLLVAAAIFTLVNLALVVTALWLSTRPAAVRPLLPDHDAVGYELATLVLGACAAEMLVHAPVLCPVLLVLVAYVHRSSVVTSLQHAARTDAKTGLLNATAWTERAAALLSRAVRAGRPVAVLVLDIDHFKLVNDCHGHLVGDRMLLAVSDCLRRGLRSHDDIGRFGGDEFVAVLEDLEPADAEQVGRRLCRAINALRTDGVGMSASIGLAHARGSDDLQHLLRRADEALYRAKAEGRNNLCAAD